MVSCYNVTCNVLKQVPTSLVRINLLRSLVLCREGGGGGEGLFDVFEKFGLIIWGSVKIA